MGFHKIDVGYRCRCTSVPRCREIGCRNCYCLRRGETGLARVVSRTRSLVDSISIELLSARGASRIHIRSAVVTALVGMGIIGCSTCHPVKALPGYVLPHVFVHEREGGASVFLGRLTPKSLNRDSPTSFGESPRHSDAAYHWSAFGRATRRLSRRRIALGQRGVARVSAMPDNATFLRRPTTHVCRRHIGLVVRSQRLCSLIGSSKNR